eukprot:7641338-Heterocapsa_arctica.AAC.1
MGSRCSEGLSNQNSSALSMRNERNCRLSSLAMGELLGRTKRRRENTIGVQQRDPSAPTVVAQACREACLRLLNNQLLH